MPPLPQHVQTRDAAPAADPPSGALRHPWDAEVARLQREVERWEARYRALTAAASLAVFACRDDGGVVEVNAGACTVLGRDAERVLGRRFGELVAPEDLPRADEEWEACTRRARGRSEVELRVLRPSGERRVLRASYATLAPGSPGSPAGGVQILARDVTEERAREEQLRRAERMAGVAPLLRGICHELNNPLTSIRSFAELLLLDRRPAEDREALEIVVREADRAARIVADLRVVAHQTQEDAGVRVLLDLEQPVRAALEAEAAALDELEVDLTLDFPAGLPQVWANPGQLAEAVAQLVANGWQAMRRQPRPRRLALRAYPCEAGVALRVQDSGPGIDPADLHRVFDPLFTTKEPGEGTGLGLSLVQSIVADHGGRVMAESRPGQGAAFTVELPVVEPMPAA
jgi:two-component system, NtrC family, sensor kinase